MQARTPKLAFPGMKESNYRKYREELVRAGAPKRRVNKRRNTPLLVDGAKLGPPASLSVQRRYGRAGLQ